MNTALVLMVSPSVAGAAAGSVMLLAGAPAVLAAGCVAAGLAASAVTCAVLVGGAVTSGLAAQQLEHLRVSRQVADSLSALHASTEALHLTARAMAEWMGGYEDEEEEDDAEEEEDPGPVPGRN